MNKANLAVIALTLLTVFYAFGRPIDEQPNRESVVEQINSVTILNFQTDKPVTEMRLTMDGKAVDTEIVQTAETGLWLAIVPMNDRIEIHIKAGTQNLLMSAQWPRLFDSMTRENMNFGPGKQLSLDGWVEVYSVARITIEGKEHGSLKLEIK